jgi:hypothetical protein
MAESHGVSLGSCDDPRKGSGASKAEIADPGTYRVFTIQPLLVCNNPTVVHGDDSSMRAAAALIVPLLLAGCASEAPVVESPTMYTDMAVSGARLDATAAATMISLYRQNNGLGTVVVDPELMRLAESQSQAMADKNKLDHDVRAPLAKRLTGAGYQANVAVENVSAGYHTLAEAFSGWRDSPPHKANMLKNGVTKIGIAASYAPNTKYKVFWTMILAAPDKQPS